MRTSRRLPLGVRVADFCLTDEAGSSRCFHDLLGRGSVLIWLFRGHG